MQEESIFVMNYIFWPLTLNFFYGVIYIYLKHEKKNHNMFE